MKIFQEKLNRLEKSNHIKNAHYVYNVPTMTTMSRCNTATITSCSLPIFIEFYAGHLGTISSLISIIGEDLCNKRFFLVFIWNLSWLHAHVRDTLDLGSQYWRACVMHRNARENRYARCALLLFFLLNASERSREWWSKRWNKFE